MEYGNTTQHLKRSIIIGLIFAIVIIAIFVPTAINYGTFKSENYLLMFGMPLLIGVLFPAIVLLTMISSLRINNGTVQSVLLGKWVLKEARLNDLTAVEISNNRGSAVVLHFTGNRKIHLWAAHMRVIKKLMTDLKQSSPDAEFIIPSIFKPIYEKWL